MTTLPARVDDDLNVGLEDIDSSDMMMPTLRLNHGDGVMEDSLSGETFDRVTAIPLGVIKNRILWPAEMGDDKAPPLCRSLNFTEGIPDGDNFPWKAAGFDRAKFEEGENLPCANCALKEWGSHPKTETPWCSEQWVVPMMLAGGPALFTLQRSSLKGIRAYVTSFARARQPLFVNYVKISLNQQRRGSVKFVVPQFAKGDATDEADHRDLADAYRRVRDYVQTPRAEDAPSETKVSVGTKSESAYDDDDIEFDE